MKNKLSLDDIIKFSEALDRIERKLDIALKLFNPPRLDIKGYSVKNIDLKTKVAYFKTKGNKE
jgi:hypothetical protein